MIYALFIHFFFAMFSLFTNSANGLFIVFFIHLHVGNGLNA